MKQPNYLIRIPEPCNEDWNNMQPDSTGKFCSSCSKSVIDFSNKTDTEIRDILLQNKGQKVCGHFKSSQVNRPLNLRINLGTLPANMSLSRRFALAVLVVFGTLLFSCTDHLGNKIGEIEVEEKEYIMGALPPGFVPEIDSIVPPEPVLMGDTVYVEEMLKGEVAVEDSVEVTEPPVLEKHMTEITMGAVWYEPEEVTDSVLTIFMEEPSVEIPPDTMSARTSNTGNEELTTTTELVAFKVYPNPSTNVFNISYENLGRSDISFHIFDMQGCLVKPVVNIKEQHEGTYVIPVDLNDLPNGIYLVNMIKEGKRYSERLVLSR